MGNFNTAYRKKPVLVHAVRLDFTDFDRTYEELKSIGVQIGGPPTDDARSRFLWRNKNALFGYKLYLGIPTLEGEMEASDGDWIIKGVNGEFYPCKPDIFEKTYQKNTDSDFHTIEDRIAASSWKKMREMQSTGEIFILEFKVPQWLQSFFAKRWYNASNKTEKL